VLSVPSGVDVRKVDLSIELQILAFHAQRRAVVRVAGHGDRDWTARGAVARRQDGQESAGPGDMPIDGQTGTTAQAVAQ
jgi:redox-sensing transcriptional repressor